MIPTSPFGGTGHQSIHTIFGAAAFWSVTQAEANVTLDVLLQYGINHIDTAASYNESEIHVGPWMKHHRDQFFLATKTEARTRPDARIAPTLAGSTANGSRRSVPASQLERSAGRHLIVLRTGCLATRASF